MELFQFYTLSFFVASLSGAGLSHIGKHYNIRGNVLEIFLLSQLALLGNLLSKILFHGHGTDWSGVLLSFLFFGLGKLLLFKVKIGSTQRSTFMVGGYLFLLSLQYLIIGYFPQLDSHISIGFFGNMVTANSFENLLIIISFSLFAILYLLNFREINRKTIEISILNAKNDSKRELLLFSIPLITSLYSLGFLYTMSFLLLPSLVIGASFKNEKIATFSIIAIAAFTSLSGLGLSIYFERISTTSVQIFLLFILLLGVRLAKILSAKTNTNLSINKLSKGG